MHKITNVQLKGQSDQSNLVQTKIFASRRLLTLLFPFTLTKVVNHPKDLTHIFLLLCYLNH